MDIMLPIRAKDELYTVPHEGFLKPKTRPMIAKGLPVVISTACFSSLMPYPVHMHAGTFTLMASFPSLLYSVHTRSGEQRC